jgi:transposase-like protein
MKPNTEQLLKVDVAGRVWTPRKMREGVLDEFERSGMAATEFAARLGVKYSTFANWVQQRRRQRQAGKPPALPRLVEAVVAQPEASPSIRAVVVHLPCGARMEIADGVQAAIAAELLRALGAGGAGC